MTDLDTAQIQVLLVEDEPGDAGLAQIALRGFRNARFAVAWVQTLAEAVSRIGVVNYDIVLLDLTLPDSIGIDTVARIRTVAGATPIIVLTGQSDTDFGLSTLKAGAADYLVKGDFGYDGLARTILYTLHRARLEQELAEHRFHLEELVDQRTAELALAKEAAEAANRAKTAFLANMSHELRTPLNAILGFAQLMERDSALDERHRGELRTINRSGRHLLALINDVLEIARIEAGRTLIQSKPFDLSDILRSVEEMIRQRAEAKELRFVVEQQGTLPFCVLGDAHHLRQVLINLLGNAVKYTDQGQISLRLTPSDGHILFEVIDTGTGIDPSEQQRIFQPFYQTEAGATFGEGAGLGLAISREFVRLMGGEISVESQPGQGSVFAFSLPLPATDAVAAAIPSVQARVLGLAEGQAPVRILVAEDKADSRDLIVRLLGSVGFEVRGAENGAQAVASFKEWRPHFIWMDIRMPVMDGYEATRQIRALPGGDQVKIVALTASVFQERLGDILDAGCDDILSKPFEEEHLFRIMGDLLNLQYRYAEAAPESVNRIFDLSEVSLELRATIKQAAEALDLDAFAGIIESLRQNHPTVADELEVLVNEFRFEQIQRAAADTGQELLREEG